MKMCVFRFNSEISRGNISVIALCLLLGLVQVASVWHGVKHGDLFSNLGHEHYHHEHAEKLPIFALRSEHVGHNLPDTVQEHPDCTLCSLHAGEAEYIVAIEKDYQLGVSHPLKSSSSLLLSTNSNHQNARAPPIS